MKLCRLVQSLGSTVVAIPLFISGLAHMANTHAFQQTILSYDVAPSALLPFLATFIPLFQITLACCLVCNAFRSSGLALASLLFAGFLAAQLSVLFRSMEISCGCFGASGTTVSPGTVVFTSLLLVISLLTLAVEAFELRESVRRGRKGMTSTSFARPAFSLVEVVCAIGILGFLAAITIPAIQDIREIARSTSCGNRLRQISTAAQAFNASHRRLPPGTLGFDTVIEVEAANSSEHGYIADPSSPIYYSRAQNTSSLVLLLPWLENEALHRKLPAKASSIGSLYYDIDESVPEHSWLGDVPAMASLARTSVQEFLCPSDNLEAGISAGNAALITSQPGFAIDDSGTGLPGDVMLTHLVDSDGLYQGCNYTACAGAHSGGEQPTPELRAYTGIMSCRQRVSAGRIKDGASNTIMYGETIGSIHASDRSGAYVWCFGGLARGRGAWDWMKEGSTGQKQMHLLGDAWYSSHNGFGAMHPATVNFVMADGAVTSVSRRVDWRVFYQLCGAQDGNVLPQ